MKFLMACLIMLLLFPDKLLAQTALPHVFNFHTTLRDDNGNLVESDFIDLEFQIVDGQGNVLFSESQPGVQVVRSAVAVVVGEESGGIPLEVFDPATGSKLLKYKIAGNEFSDGIELNAYPYSLWSEKALGVVDNAIGSEQIKDGSIELKDLAKSIEFTDVKGISTEAQIPTSFATDVELATHANAAQAHWAKQIRVEGPFMLHTSTNVEDLLSTLDAKVYLNMVNAKEDVTKASTGLTTSLAQEITDRKSGDTLVQGNINTHMSATTAHGSDGTVVGVNTLNTAVSGLQGKIDTANTNITNLQNTTANINNLPGTLGESKIDATITRDTEVVSLVDPTFTTNAEATTIASSQITAALSNNTIPNTAAEIGAAPTSHTHASGDLPSSTSYLGGSIESGEISDGTITTSDMASKNVSQWTNDSAYLTSANLSGYDTDESNDLLKDGSRAMTGSLNMGGNNVTNVGAGSGIGSTVANHETRITALEGENNVPDNSVAIQQLKTTLVANGTTNCGASEYTVIDEVCQSYNGNESFTVALSAGSYLPIYEMNYSVAPNSVGSASMKPTIEVHAGNIKAGQVCAQARIYWNSSCSVGAGATSQMKYTVYKLSP